MPKLTNIGMDGIPAHRPTKPDMSGRSVGGATAEERQHNAIQMLLDDVKTQINETVRMEHEKTKLFGQIQSFSTTIQTSLREAERVTDTSWYRNHKSSIKLFDHDGRTSDLRNLFFMDRRGALPEVLRKMDALNSRGGGGMHKDESLAA